MCKTQPSYNKLGNTPCRWTYTWLQIYKTCWFESRQPSDLTRGFCEGSILSYDTIQEAESFLARYMVQYPLLAMSVKGMSIEKLPTTRDALFSQRALSQLDSSLVTSQLAEPKSTPAWIQGMGDGRYLFGSPTLLIHAQLLVCAGSPLIHACTNNFCLTSGEVFNYCSNWYKASFASSNAGIQEENDTLHICWLSCNYISIHLRWHEKEQAFVAWFWAKPRCLDALLFRKSMHREL